MACSDQDFITALRASSDAAAAAHIADLRTLLRKALARSFGRQLGDSDLDDMVQESLLRIHSKLDGFEQKSQFTTWAIAISVRCALSELRRRRYRQVSLEQAVVDGEAALSAEPPSPVQGELAVVHLRQGITNALTERQREATLARLSGLPLSEIARRLDTTQGAVYKLLHDARLRLKEYMQALEHSSEPFTHAPAGSP